MEDPSGFKPHPTSSSSKLLLFLQDSCQGGRRSYLLGLQGRGHQVEGKAWTEAWRPGSLGTELGKRGKRNSTQRPSLRPHLVLWEPGDGAYLQVGASSEPVTQISPLSVLGIDHLDFRYLASNFKTI